MAHIHHFRKGLPPRILDQLASHPSRIDSLQGLMDVTLELDTRYHERQKEKSHHQEKKPESSKSNSSHPQNSSSSSQKKKNFQKKGKPHSSFLNKEFNNDVSSAKSCAALVGDSRTPSFPFSVHIPSLNYHQSLLSSRDEVFRKIQDVGGDNSVSSLHLFFGNMDLPPSSYYDSLEELWDEEEDPEEIETMLKVFPSVYHQYLDVFSKVKPEKLPPHCTCDHHIKLEGSLPPVGVSYSLSNQESDTLRAYISENVEKGFICPSSSSIGAPVLFVKKKDGGLHLCVAYHKLNGVNRKNKYTVPPMSQLLTFFNGYSIFSKIDLCGTYNLLRIKEGDEHLTCFRAKYGIYEYLGMPFGLTNAAASFENLVNDIFMVFLIFMLWFIWMTLWSFPNWKKNMYLIYPLFFPDSEPTTFLIRPPSAYSMFQKALWQDSQYRSILQEFGKGKYVQDYSLDSSSQLLFFKNWVVFPNDPTIQLSILQKRHDSPLAGHPGQEKTLKLVKQVFHWSGMTQFIKDYVSSCEQCSRNKNIHHKKFGLLKPLPIPYGPWIFLSMDFITQLPLSNSFDSIMVLVDRLSRMPVFIPTMSSITSLDLAHLFIKDIISKHGLLARMKLKISRDLSTAYHPETDGKTERVNQILEHSPWMYVSYPQDYWNTWLPLAEVAYNSSDHSSTKQSVFFTVYGRDPQFESAHITQDTPAGKLSKKSNQHSKMSRESLKLP
ncbi:hypothetical protein O181_022672 [Austropuccinia psidii MF-1]|uniref:Integrase zinc-binding domain-containing protein n=1 Tax=Austropuccinia psidii MF-1 TaxID=1389203 RepID=A0A9Q3CI04_9BASI|nr:hypothetical protein [Austropuccinia psidii MF-1]